MTDLLQLAKRVEALDGPDREVDRAIRQIFGHAWDYAADWDRLNTATGIKETNPVAKPYTASLDAAMMLVPEGWRFCVTNSNGAWVRMSDSHPTIHGNNNHPALALVAAALRAKEATNGQ